MGYEPGKGLGKKLQGITTPIEAKLRKGKGAIGLYGPEQPTMTRASGPGAVTAEAEVEEKDVKKHQRQWKKKDGDSQLKVKYVYKTADEVVQEGANKRFRGDSLSSVKVIDMTGPEQRILSGYHQIHQQHSKPPDQEEDSQAKTSSRGYHFSLPELEHNLKLLEEDEKQKIIRCDRQKQFAQDKLINLEHEQNRLEEVITQEEKQIKTLEKVLKIVESLDNKSDDDDSNTTLEIAARTFKDLQDEYYEEYKLYNLSDLAITIVVPLVKKLLADWNPLEQKHHCIDIFQDWKALLESNSSVVSWSQGTEQELEPYHRLVWDVWMPPVRKAILGWNARNWSPLVELLDTWTPLLPPWVMGNILEQLVLPRLQKEVEAWNPLTDTLPVHSWLHPWLPLMGSRLEPLYAPIRHKLAAALVNWHPSDCSAKLILEPWKTVFSQGVMDAFVINNIVPKLAMALQAYVINPHQQHLDVWNWVMAWLDMMPEPCMITLLEKNFFPKWLQVLYTWLTHSPNYEEVTKWYTGWKSMLPPSLLTHPTIKEQFRQALDIMNRAVSAPQGLLGQQPGAKESMAYLTNVERQQELDRHVKPRRDYEAMMQTIRGSTSAASLTLSFKELIEKKAEESNILFMPVPGRFQEGKQVHRFGSSLLYLDRGVIFVFNQKTWVPTSLQSLLDTAG
ncbi:Tuftelin-interacting protein 11, partial [Stegodyphus mimosarum]